MPSSLPERTLIWCEIKAAVPVMLKNGVSSVGVLIWSQGKSLKEVVCRVYFRIAHLISVRDSARSILHQ